MKAVGYIAVASQKPFMVFGVQPRIFLISMTIPLAFIALIEPVIGTLPAFLTGLVGAVITYVGLKVKTRQNIHFEEEVFLGLRWFKITKTERHLVCGTPRKKFKKHERPFKK